MFVETKTWGRSANRSPANVSSTGMKQPKRRKQLPSGLAGSYAEDDGLDPRFDPTVAHEAGLDSGGKERRKLRQLCAQVARSLELAWPDDTAPLETTRVDQVLPAPNSHQLLVLVHCNRQSREIPDVQLLAALQAVSGRLRQAVAADIHRKRVPQLRFAIVPRDA